MRALNEEGQQLRSYFLVSSPEGKLKRILRFVNTPLPEREEEWLRDEWQQLTREMIALYNATIGFGYFVYGKVVTRDARGEIKDNPRAKIHMLRPTLGPPLPAAEGREWLPHLQREVSTYLQSLSVNLTRKRVASIADLPSVHYREGTRYSLVEGSGVLHFYESQDATSAFLLMLGDLLAEVDVSKIQPCRVCKGLFYKVKGQQYCSRECTLTAHPSKKRVEASRRRKARWKQARKKLELLLTNAQQEPIEQSRKVMTAARTAFEKAFPRKTGHGYKEGKVFLAHAEKQIRLAPWEREREALKSALEKMRTLYQTTEKQALEEAEDAYRRACAALESVFSNKNERGYKEGKEFLNSANAQIRRLRKKVKGY